MLSKGFKDQIYDVYRYLPPETQVLGVQYRTGSPTVICVSFIPLLPHNIRRHASLLASLLFVELLFSRPEPLIIVTDVNDVRAMMQVVLVSATLPHDVLEMTNKFMTDPVRVLVKRDELTLEVCIFVSSSFVYSSSCHHHAAPDARATRLPDACRGSSSSSSLWNVRSGSSTLSATFMIR